jgi:beta-lactamase regulating signal transducer with metallopeptidase domain
MMWDLLPALAWKSVVTLGVTLLLLRALKHRSAAQRAWIAHIGLVATLALPLAALLLPRWEVEAAPVADLAAPMTAIFAAPPMLESAPAAPMAQAAIIWSPDPATLVLLAWGLPAALLLLAMLVAVVRLFALARRASVLVEHSWLRALAQAQARMNFKSGTALLVSREIASPVSWGVIRPVILINSASVARAGDAEAIIAHELAHVSRLDWAGLLLARTTTALFWFNPLAWLVARQAHELREEAADDAVLRSNVDRAEYAALLVGAARHEAQGFLLAANGVAPSAGSLKRRIVRVLDEKLPRAPAYLGWMLACVLGAGVMALPLAAFSATRSAQVVQAVEVALTPRPALTPQATTATYDAKYDAYVFHAPRPDVAAPVAPVAVAQAPAPAPAPQAVPAPPVPPVPQITPPPVPERIAVDIPPISIQGLPFNIALNIPGIHILADQKLAQKFDRLRQETEQLRRDAERESREAERESREVENARRAEEKALAEKATADAVMRTVRHSDGRSITINGSGKVDLGRINQDALNLMVAGSGSVSAQGSVENLVLRVTGSGRADLGHLAARHVTVLVVGSGGATIAPSEELKVMVHGSGTVRLATRPETMEKSITGSGRVIEAP